MSQSQAAPPANFGSNFTKTYHTKVEGLTDPGNIKLSNPFVVLVTGAGKGLGLHISLAYAKAGASGLIICSRTASDLENLQKQIEAINPQCTVLARVCDTTKDGDLAQLARDLQSKYGRLDVAVANAGVISNYTSDADGSNRRLPQGILEDEDFERVVQINLIGSYLVAKHFIPILMNTKDGPQAYIGITSVASLATHSTYTPIAYNLTKMALNRLVESIHDDHNEKDGIHAYALHPGAVVTPQTEHHPGEIWGQILNDDIGLCGGFCAWLTSDRRGWLSGRYLSSNWDPNELEGMKDEIVQGGKLRLKTVF